MKLCWALAATLLLSACASSPILVERRGDLETLPEKSLYEALEKTGAQQPQRVTIMTAYDEMSAEGRRLTQQQNGVLQRWRALSRQDGEFLPQAKALSAEWGQLAADRMNLQSGFERRVAATLDAEQWQRWQAFVAEDAERRIRLENFGGAYVGGGATRTRRR